MGEDTRRRARRGRRGSRGGARARARGAADVPPRLRGALRRVARAVGARPAERTPHGLKGGRRRGGAGRRATPRGGWVHVVACVEINQCGGCVVDGVEVDANAP